MFPQHNVLPPNITCYPKLWLTEHPLCRGVFQTLVEKHFPAPDRRKTHDLFGLGSSLFGESPQSSPTPLSGKRKKDLGE